MAISRFLSRLAGFLDSAGKLTQTGLAANVAGNGPAFSAYQSVAQTLISSTFTKIQLQAEEFDTASCFDSTTNYRFTPTVAGYYQVTGGVGCNVASGAGIAEVWKNGLAHKRGAATGALAGASSHVTVSALVYLNGSTDYIELYGYQSSGGNGATWTGTSYNYFQAFLARAA
jgi:hypothetical protein